jgi:hypothetical protein
MKKCTICKIEKPLSEYHKSKALKSGHKGDCKNCVRVRKQANKEYISNYRKKYYQENLADELKRSKNWRKDNKGKKAEQTTKYYNKRRANDDTFRVLSNLRSRLYRAFKNASLDKKYSTKDLLGCTSKELRIHIERQFAKDMSWDNYGEWHIDHIIPLSSGKTQEEINFLCHYSNLQPLWALDNIKKGNR